MKTHFLILFTTIVFVKTSSILAAEPGQAALQKGLLEEEVNQNLDAAIQSYQAVLASFEEQRKIAATATFRLGECYRKLGRTNLALAQFQNLVTAFPEQTALVKLSQKYLADAPGTAAPESSAPVDLEQVRLLGEEIALVQQQINAAERAAKNGQDTFTEVIRLKRELLGLQRKLPANSSPARQQDLIQQQIQLAQQLVDACQKRIEVGGAPPNDLIPLKRDLLELQRELLVAKQAGPSRFQNRLNQIVRRVDVSDALAEEDAKEIQRLQDMIKNSPDLINSTAGSDTGVTPLENAAAKGRVEVARFLLDNGASLMGSGERKETPLHYAALNGHRAMVELLLARGAQVDARNNNGETPLHNAARNGYQAVAQVLLDHGADVNARTSYDLTPLLIAVLKGQIAMVDFLLTRQADINAQTNEGQTPLAIAASQGDAAMVDLLLAHHAELNHSDKSGQTALTLSIQRSGFGPITQKLLEAGANPNVTTSFTVRNPGGSVTEWREATPLLYAVSTRDTAGLELLLKHGANVNPQNERGETSLLLAVRLDLPKEVSLLLRAGADPNIKGVGEHTPLQEAIAIAASNRGTPRPAYMPKDLLPDGTDMIKELVAHGANPNLNGATPLLFLVRAGQSNLVSLLLEKGADVNGKISPEGYTALQVAAAKGDTNMMGILLSKKADVNAQDSAGNTPLHDAAANGHIDAVRMLVQHGADPALADRDGLTPSEFVKNLTSAPGSYVLDSWGIPGKTIGAAGFNGVRTDLLNPPPLSPEQKAIVDLLQQGKAASGKPAE